MPTKEPLPSGSAETIASQERLSAESSTSSNEQKAAELRQELSRLEGEIKTAEKDVEILQADDESEADVDPEVMKDDLAQLDAAIADLQAKEAHRERLMAEIAALEISLAEGIVEEPTVIENPVEVSIHAGSPEPASIEQAIENSVSVEAEIESLTREISAANGLLLQDQRRYDALDAKSRLTSSEKAEEIALKKRIADLKKDRDENTKKRDDLKVRLKSVPPSSARTATPPPIASSAVESMASKAAVVEASASNNEGGAVQEKREKPPMTYEAVWEAIDSDETSPEALSKAVEVYIQHHLPTRDKIDAEIERRTHERPQGVTESAKQRSVYRRLFSRNYLNDGEEASVGPEATLSSEIQRMSEVLAKTDSPILKEAARALVDEQVGVIEDFAKDERTAEALVQDIVTDAGRYELSPGQSLGSNLYNLITPALRAADLAIASGQKDRADQLISSAEKLVKSMEDKVRQQMKEGQVVDNHNRVKSFFGEEIKRLDEARQKIVGADLKAVA